jgi:hypothetical protein
MENAKLLELKGITVEIIDSYGRLWALWSIYGHVIIFLIINYVFFLMTNTIMFHNGP